MSAFPSLYKTILYGALWNLKALGCSLPLLSVIISSEHDKPLLFFQIVLFQSPYNCVLETTSRTLRLAQHCGLFCEPVLHIYMYRKRSSNCFDTLQCKYKRTDKGHLKMYLSWKKLKHKLLPSFVLQQITHCHIIFPVNITSCTEAS